MYFLAGAGITCGALYFSRRSRHGQRGHHMRHPGQRHPGHRIPASPASQPVAQIGPVAGPAQPMYQSSGPGAVAALPASSPAYPRRAAATASGAPPPPVNEFHVEGTLGGETF